MNSQSYFGSASQPNPAVVVAVQKAAFTAYNPHRDVFTSLCARFEAMEKQDFPIDPDAYHEGRERQNNVQRPHLSMSEFQPSGNAFITQRDRSSRPPVDAHPSQQASNRGNQSRFSR